MAPCIVDNPEILEERTAVVGLKVGEYCRQAEGIVSGHVELGNRRPR